MGNESHKYQQENWEQLRGRINVRIAPDPDPEKWKPLHYPYIQAVTNKAVLFSGMRQDQWIPISQMAMDNDGVVYAKTWIYEKIIGAGEK